jgi:hypothetical protein
MAAIWDFPTFVGGPADGEPVPSFSAATIVRPVHPASPETVAYSQMTLLLADDLAIRFTAIEAESRPRRRLCMHALVAAAKRGAK